MLHRLLLPALAPLALAFAPLEELRPAARTGEVLRTTFEQEATLELTRMSLAIDGEDVHGDLEGFELEIAVRERHVLVDRYESVEDGRPTRLVRTYEELTAQRRERNVTPNGESEAEAEGESDLDGRSVVFTREEDDSWAAELEGEGDSSLCDDLAAELGFAAFLPDGAVERGDSWDVPLSAFALCLQPGGDLKLAAEGEDLGGNDAQMVENLDGDLRATFRGEREEDGARRLVIALEAELATTAEQEVDGGVGGTTEQRNAYELTGELVWDPERGRPLHLELSGEVESVLTTRRQAERGDRTFEVEQVYELAGPVSYRLDVAPE